MRCRRNNPDIVTNGLYVQDQWTLNRLTANVGLRSDYLHAWVPAQTRPAGYFTPSYSFDMRDVVPKWRDISPRLGIAYDLFGNGKTAVKASFGRYVAAESLSIAQATNPVNAIVINATRTWSDPNFDPTINTSPTRPRVTSSIPQRMADAVRCRRRCSARARSGRPIPRMFCSAGTCAPPSGRRPHR
jgi:hypothetical protein